MKPIININGSSKERLLEAAQEAYQACRTLRDAVQATCPHGRDYQVMDPAGIQYREDKAEWNERIEGIDLLAESLMRDAMHLADQA